MSDVDRWWLEDVRLRRAEAPYTFYQPSEPLIARLAPGDSAKLIFGFESQDPRAPAAERMWVEITERDGDHFRGVLDNTPHFLRGLSLGDAIEFEAHHIADTGIGEDDGLERFARRCFVTARVLRDGEPVGYLYREEPDRDDDSGWRIMAGDESDEYMDDPDNVYYVALGAVLNRDDSFLHLLDSPAGSAFGRDAGGADFHPEAAPEPG